MLDALQGDSTLFIRHDEVEASWEFIDRIIQAWQEHPEWRVYPYPAGSWGPDAAKDFIERDERQWILDEGDK